MQNLPANFHLTQWELTVRLPRRNVQPTFSVLPIQNQYHQNIQSLVIFHIIYKLRTVPNFHTFQFTPKGRHISRKWMQSEIQQWFYKWDTEQTLCLDLWIHLKKNIAFSTCRLYILNERNLSDEIKDTNQKPYTKGKSHCFWKDQTVLTDVTPTRKYPNASSKHSIVWP